MRSQLDDSVVDPQRARELADEILGRSDLAEPPRTPFQIAVDWLGDRFSDVIDTVFNVAGGAAGVVVLAALVAVVLFAIFRARRTLERDAQVTFDTESSGKTSPEEWDAAAERAAAAGRYDDAIRCRLRSVLAALDRSGVLDELDGRTSGEYRSAAKQVLPLEAAGAFDELANAFDGVWYGDLPADARLSAEANELARQVRSQVRTS
jgi:hypothetical protein